MEAMENKNIKTQSFDFQSIVLYEDNHLLIVNKPTGILTQKDKEDRTLPNLEDLGKEFLQKKYNKPSAFIGICHRIDRPTSGIVILCKTSKSLERMSRIFQQKLIQKTYWAITRKNENTPDEGHLINYLKRSEKENKSYIHASDAEGAKRSELLYKVISKGDLYQLVEVTLLTGRHHQIRVQLSNIGFALKGDAKYGAKRPNKDKGIDLHSGKIEFIHPISQEKMVITASFRDEPLWNALSMGN